jgi:hypothetical protein
MYIGLGEHKFRTPGFIDLYRQACDWWHNFDTFMSNVLTSSDMSTHFWVGIREQPLTVYKAFHGKQHIGEISRVVDHSDILWTTCSGGICLILDSVYKCLKYKYRWWACKSSNVTENYCTCVHQHTCDNTNPLEKSNVTISPTHTDFI